MKEVNEAKIATFFSAEYVKERTVKRRQKMIRDAIENAIAMGCFETNLDFYLTDAEDLELRNLGFGVYSWKGRARAAHLKDYCHTIRWRD